MLMIGNLGSRGATLAGAEQEKLCRGNLITLDNRK